MAQSRHREFNGIVNHAIRESFPEIQIPSSSQMWLLVRPFRLSSTSPGKRPVHAGKQYAFSFWRGAREVLWIADHLHGRGPATVYATEPQRLRPAAVPGCEKDVD